jgi:hypothetical protein
VDDETSPAPRLLTLQGLWGQMWVFCLGAVACSAAIVATRQAAIGLGAAGVLLIVWWLASLRYCHPLLEMRYTRSCGDGMFGPTDRGRAFRRAWTEAGGDRVMFERMLDEAERAKRAGARTRP